jgi:hypothetical protein
VSAGLGLTPARSALWLTPARSALGLTPARGARRACTRRRWTSRTSTPPRGKTRSRPVPGAPRAQRGAARAASQPARAASPRAPAPAPAHRARCAATDIPAARAAVAQEHANARSRDLRGRRAGGPRAAPLAAVGVDAPPRAAFPALAPPRNLLFGRRQRVAGPSPPRSARHCPRAARALASRGQD